jgi:hypothetical protein
MYRGNYNKHNDLIKRMLLERCLELDLNGTERILLIECKHDLSLYILYMLEHKMVMDELFMEYFSQFVLDYDIGLDHTVQPILSVEQELQYDIDCEKYAKILVDEWWNKFQIRTQIKLNRTKEDNRAMDMMAGAKQVFTPEEMIDLNYYITTILIKNGERVFLRMMVNNLITGVIAIRVNKNKVNFTPQDKLQLTQTIGFEAKRLTEKSGALIVMFADKNYYSAKLREWRDDEHGQIL